METGIRIATVAHAGDGNAHPLLLVEDGEEGRARTWAAADAIFSVVAALGGTVSGEHGIGRLKLRWFAAEVGQTSIDVQLSIKAALDPLCILNPGSILP